MAVQATIDFPHFGFCKVVKGRRNGGSSNTVFMKDCHFCVVKGRRNGGSSNYTTAVISAKAVVKGRRNGGSSNFSFLVCVLCLRCERPPKWRFKQLCGVMELIIMVL